MPLLNIDNVRALAIGDEVCVQNCEGGTMVQSNGGKTVGFQGNVGATEQIWVVAALDGPNRVALKLKGSEGFLAPQAPRNGVQCVTTAPQTWWEAKQGSRDGAISLFMPSSPNIFLCLNYGRSNNGNPVFTWVFAPVFHDRMSWWLRTPPGRERATNKPPQEASKAPSDAEAKKRADELHAREEELQRSHDQLKQLQADLEKQQVDLKTNAEQLTEKTKALESREKQNKEEREKWEAERESTSKELDERRKAADAREAALQEREAALKAREDALASSKDTHSSTPQSTEAPEAADDSTAKELERLRGIEKQWLAHQNEHSADNQQLVHSRPYAESEAASEYGAEDWIVEKQSLEDKIEYLQQQLAAAKAGRSPPPPPPRQQPNGSEPRTSTSSRGPLRNARGFHIPPPSIGLELRGDHYEKGALGYRLKTTGYNDFSFLKRL